MSLHARLGARAPARGLEEGLEHRVLGTAEE